MKLSWRAAQIGLALGTILGLMPGFALAENPQPPAGSLHRIAWAMECAGAMPPLLAGALIVIGELTVLAIPLHFYWRGKKRHE